MEKLHTDNLRKEVKFLFSNHQLIHYRNLIQHLGWYEEFPMRTVHTIYFDTIENDFLFDTLYGIRKREKIRLRFYNNYSEVHFEQKIKNDIYGLKKRKLKYNLAAIDNISLRKMALDASNWIGHKISPSSYVIYQRYYYNNLDNNIRITFDIDLQSKDLKNFEHRNLKNYCICEVKIGVGQSCNLPFNGMSSKFSKYVFSRIGNEIYY